MDNKSYGSGGAIFTRDKRSANSADWGGDIVLEGPELEYVLRKAQSGEPVQLEVGAWKKEGRKGQFLSLKIQLPYAVRQQGQQQDRGFPTTRGNYPPQGQQQQGRNNYADARGRPQQQGFRQELNDDFPASLGGGRGPAPVRTARKEPPPWE